MGPNAVNFRGYTRSAPAWAKDFGGREHILAMPAKVDPTAFTDSRSIVVNVTAIAAIDATTIAVTALAYPFGYVGNNLSGNPVVIAAGTVLDFGAKKFAVLTADAKIGDTALTVRALPTALAVSDKARYDSTAGIKYLQSGTLVGRTYTEQAAKTPYGPAVDTDDEFYIVLFDNPDLYLDPSIELYRPGGQVAINYLPDYTAIAANANLLAKLRATYRCFNGVN